MLGRQNKQVEQAKPFDLRPIHHIDVRGVHPVIVDDVLTFENKPAQRF